MSDGAPPGTDARAGDGFEASDHDRFTGWLRERSEPDWTRAVDHRFVEELASDGLDAYGRELPARGQRRVLRNFRRAVALEVAFFDAAYQPEEGEGSW